MLGLHYLATVSKNTTMKRMVLNQIYSSAQQNLLMAKPIITRMLNEEKWPRVNLDLLKPVELRPTPERTTYYPQKPTEYILDDNLAGEQEEELTAAVGDLRDGYKYYAPDLADKNPLLEESGEDADNWRDPLTSKIQLANPPGEEQGGINISMT